MKSSGLSRRGVLNGTVALAATGVVAAVARPSIAVAAGNACGGLTREEFLEYVALFNANDPKFIRYYHDDVVFELPNTVVKGATAIREFYKPVKEHIHEKVEVAAFVSDA